MNTIKKQARVAGWLYLLVAITAPIGLVYVPGKLIQAGDAAATATHIRNSELLFRIGIASELLHEIIFIFLVLALYRLFKSVNQSRAAVMVILGAYVSAPIVFLTVVNEMAALILLSGVGFLSVFDKPQLEALAYLFIRLHGAGIIIAQIFWGLWLFPFGSLVIKSRFIPWTLGLLLFIAGAGYVVGAFTLIVLPQYGHAVGQVTRILGIAEVPIIFWLLIWGAKVRPSDAPTS